MHTTSLFQDRCGTRFFQCVKLGLPALALLVVFVSLLPINAFATSPRTSALGGDNTFMEDDSNVLRWYGSLTEYGNQVSIGTGHHNLADNEPSWYDTLSGFSTGIHFNLGSGGTAAFYFNEFMRDNDVSTSTREDAENSLMVMYARSLGPIQVGLSLRHGGQEYSVALDTVGGRPLTHREHSCTTVGLGIRSDLSETSYVDAAIDLHRINWDDIGYNSDQGNQETFNNISLRTRGFVAIGPTMALVPAIEYWSENSLDFSPWSFFSSLPLGNKGTMFRMGCGLNYFPNSDNFLLISADYRDARDEISEIYGTFGSLGPYHYEMDLQQFSILLATETRWNHWLTLRGSAGCQFIDFSKSRGFPKETSDNLFPMSIGAGIHLAGFDIDMAIASHEPALLAPNWNALESDEPSIQARGSWFSANLRYLF